MANHFIVKGTSAPQRFQVLAADENFDNTGITIDIETRPAANVSVAWESANSGVAVVTGCENLRTGKYQVRFALTDVDDKVIYVPNEPAADIWTVGPVFNPDLT